MSPADVQPQAETAIPATEAGTLAPSILNLVDERTRELIRRRRHGTRRRRGWLVRRALAAADAIGLLVAFAFAELVFTRTGNPNVADHVHPALEIVAFVVTLPGWILLARLYGLYDRDEARTDYSTVDDVFGVFNMTTTGAWVFFALTNYTRLANPVLPKVLLFWFTAIFVVSAGRVAARGLCRRSDAYVQNTLIVGAGHVGQRVAQKLLQHPEYGVNLVGFVDEQPRERDERLADLTVLGEVDRLPELVRELDVERVIIAFSQHLHTRTLELIRNLNDLDVQVDVVPRLFEVLGPHVTIHSAEGLPLLGLPSSRLSRSSIFLKRAMDIMISGFGLLVVAPLFPLVAIAIKLDSRGPIFFSQMRKGKGDRTFRILKLRTMSADADAHKHEVSHLNKHVGGDERMFKIPDDPRVTRVGRFVRRTSIDELPQLWNVLRGQMSLVGPRPLIMDEHRYVDGWGLRRLDLKPGITGLWQVLGRDDIPFGEMVELDYRYVTSWSISNDLKLLARTLPAVAQRGSF